MEVLLDVEVVQIPFGADLIVAFDVIGIDPRNSVFCKPPDLLGRHYGFEYSDFNGFLGYFLSNRIPEAARERHALLLSVINKISMSRLFSKPIVEASEAAAMWQFASGLPYPTNGLIFCPSERSRNIVSPSMLKWKPQKKLTIDVALGQESCSSCFLPFIKTQHGSLQKPSGDFFYPGHASFYHCVNQGSSALTLICTLEIAPDDGDSFSSESNADETDCKCFNVVEFVRNSNSGKTGNLPRFDNDAFGDSFSGSSADQAIVFNFKGRIMSSDTESRKYPRQYPAAELQSSNQFVDVPPEENPWS